LLQCSDVSFGSDFAQAGLAPMERTRFQ
jgi:hypothetical protein